MSAPSTTMGPVEWIAIAFPGPRLADALAPALAELVRSGTVRLLDALVVHTSVDGAVTVSELEDEDGPAFEAVDGEVLELINDDDMAAVAAGLEPDTTTLVLVWEDRWAATFGEQVAGMHGVLLAHDRLPHADVERALGAALTDEVPA
ncbi:hypothetical protein GCM10023328_27210 [Modestobacter marinus]|uniref:Putative membrane protein n=1 Tax=Modestobacter marinus TaxID=477641 RepID=A0A846LR09_9ACTN|nr:DUF6325 family protein [Modestobacter marinus]NIH69837.1 putative membrane protein [Modestobacter marinus]GGL81212.1 hypothetical protein GCM10011589_41870 [Modestobacter marinus]